MSATRGSSRDLALGHQESPGVRSKACDGCMRWGNGRHRRLPGSSPAFCTIARSSRVGAANAASNRNTRGSTDRGATWQQIGIGPGTALGAYRRCYGPRSQDTALIGAPGVLWPWRYRAARRARQVPTLASLCRWFRRIGPTCETCRSRGVSGWSINQVRTGPAVPSGMFATNTGAGRIATVYGRSTRIRCRLPGGRRSATVRPMEQLSCGFKKTKKRVRSRSKTRVSVDPAGVW